MISKRSAKPTRKQSETADPTNAMLFARWQHHIRFGSGFPYAPLKAMLTKISKWSRIQDSFRLTQNWITGSFCHSRHSQKISERHVHSFLSYLADTQTNKQSGKNITSLAELGLIMVLRTQRKNSYSGGRGLRCPSALLIW